MRIYEITEARVTPDNAILDVMDSIIDSVNDEYKEFLEQNNDQDDIEELAELLNWEVEEEGLPVVVHVNHEPRKDPNEWISAAASWEGENDKGIDIILHAKNLEGKWGPETFKQMMMRMLAHETIHFGQYDKIGKERLDKTQSGHQKGTAAVKAGGTERDWKRMYLRDPHELMAYGNDLASEIRDTADPDKTIRNIEAYRSELPTYERFRDIFPKDSKQIKQLLKYTYDYYNNG